ncbi:MAG: NAD(P)/FAD-dependent oxidoreductase, partial [Actinomycetota bacterium]|nr:NAD(P)/FAD-dependent oxidoreductase [Actinomycetota bacterium]
ATRPDGSPARVLMIDRYALGERQTSACGIPTAWLEALELMDSVRQTFSELVFATAHGTSRWPLPWTLSTFDYRELCALLFGQSDCDFEIAKVDGRSGETVHTDRGDLTAPLVVDALGWQRVLAPDAGYRPPAAPLSRGLEVHPSGESDDLAVWIDRRIVPAGGAWSFPAGDELRIGVGSFDPRFHVKDSTVKLAEEHASEAAPRAGPRRPAAEGSASGRPPRHSFQGNWIPHRLRPAVEDGVFFAGDSAGHCLPLTAEGIRTAFYFGIACGRELRQVVAGARTREDALRRYGAFSDSHEWKYRWMLRAQRAVPRVWPPALQTVVRTMQHRRLTGWAFAYYLAIAPPDFAGPAPTPRLRPGRVPEPSAV